MGPESLLLLAKAYKIWKLVEYALYGGIGLVGVKKGYDMYRDYKDSVAEESFTNAHGVSVKMKTK